MGCTDPVAALESEVNRRVAQGNAGHASTTSLLRSRPASSCRRTRHSRVLVVLRERRRRGASDKEGQARDSILAVHFHVSLQDRDAIEAASLPGQARDGRAFELHFTASRSDSFHVLSNSGFASRRSGPALRSDRSESRRSTRPQQRSSILDAWISSDVGLSLLDADRSNRARSAHRGTRLAGSA